ncbi:hypothetical protein SRABI91_04590 [Rhodococcoides fascians]|nr:hypothetical protein SRABI91_04590 [Rhodococcus fascians]
MNQDDLDAIAQDIADLSIFRCSCPIPFLA